MRRLAEERGSVLPLIIGMTALALALILAGMSATSLYFERKRLFTIADGAALVAAQSFDASRPLINGRPQLSDDAVKRAANDYLAHLSLSARHGAVAGRSTTPDGKTAVVEMRARWHPPIISVFLPVGFEVVVTAQARTVY